MPPHPDLTQYQASGLEFPLSYTQQGSGPILLLVHGSLCDYRYWRWQVAPLSQHFHVVAPSLRGYWPHAASGRNPDFSIEQHARDLAAFLRAHYPGRRAHVLGHSRGGRVALELALTEPELVDTLILAEPGLTLAGAGQAQTYLSDAVKRLEEGDREAALAGFVDAISGEGTWQKMVAWFKTMVRDNADTLLSQAREIGQSFDPADTEKLKHPVLLLGGANSPARYGAMMDALMPHLGHVERHTIPMASHGLNLANPRTFNERVRQFLSKA